MQIRTQTEVWSNLCYQVTHCNPAPFLTQCYILLLTYIQLASSTVLGGKFCTFSVTAKSIRVWLTDLNDLLQHFVTSLLSGITYKYFYLLIYVNS